MCVGAGVDLICAADIRYCTEDAYIVGEEENSLLKKSISDKQLTWAPFSFSLLSLVTTQVLWNSLTLGGTSMRSRPRKQV